MFRIWARLAWAGLVGIVAALGCRTQQPNLKPPPSPEVMNSPPQEGRFNTSSLPKQAFQQPDPLKRIREGDGQGIIPARGAFGPGGASGPVR